MTVTVSRWRDDLIRHLRLVPSILNDLNGIRSTEPMLEPLKTVLGEIVRLRDNPPSDISYSNGMALESLRVMLKRFPPVNVGGLFHFVGDMDYGERAQQIERIVGLLADARSPEAPQASQSNLGEGTARASGKVPKAPGRSHLKPGDAAQAIASALRYLAHNGRWKATVSEILELAKVPRSTYHDNLKKNDLVKRAKREYDAERLGRGPTYADEI